MAQRIKAFLKNNYRQVIFVAIYLLLAFLISFLIRKSHYNDNQKTYDDVEFSMIGDNYVSEMFAFPASIQKTTITYGSSMDCQIAIYDGNEELYRQDAPAAEGGNIVSLLYPVPKATSRLYISFLGVAEDAVSVYNVDFLSTESLNKDGIAKAVMAFMGMFFILVFILLVRNNRLSNYQTVAIVVLAITTLYVSMPLFTDYIASGHDLWTHCGRIEGFAESIRDGQKIPVVIPSAFNGFGVLSFEYPQVSLYLPAALRLMDVSMPLAYHIFLFAINVATAVICYISLRSVLKDIEVEQSEEKITYISLVGTVFYMMSSYRLSDLYIRAAVGEVMAMMVLPLVVAGLYHVYTGNKKKWYMLALGITGIMQTHILSCMLIIPIIVIMAIPFIKKIFAEKRWIQCIYTVAMFLVLNLWYIIPFIKFYKLPLNTDNLVEPNVLKHVVKLSRLFTVTLNTTYEEGADFTLSIGSACFIIVLFMIVYFAEKIKDSNRFSSVTFNMIFTMSICFFGSILLSSEVMPLEWARENSPKLWNAISILQFPYRLLSIAVVCALFMFALALLKQTAISKYAPAIMLLVVGISIYDSSILMEDYERSALHSVEVQTGNFTSHMPGDYLPAGTLMEYFDDSDMHLEDGEVIEYHKTGTNVMLTYNSAVDTHVTVPLMYYPCYEANDENGNRLSVYQNEDKRIKLNLPAGQHTVIMAARYSLW